MELKYKKLHPDAFLKDASMPGDAGRDISFVSAELDKHGNICYYTGIAIELPEFQQPFTVFAAGLMKSSGSKHSLILANAMGVIDFGYRGEIIFKFKPVLSFDSDGEISFKPKRKFKKGEAVGQLIVMLALDVKPVKVDKLSSTERESKGYGQASGNE